MIRSTNTISIHINFTKAYVHPISYERYHISALALSYKFVALANNKIYSDLKHPKRKATIRLEEPNTIIEDNTLEMCGTTVIYVLNIKIRKFHLFTKISLLHLVKES